MSIENRACGPGVRRAGLGTDISEFGNPGAPRRAGTWSCLVVVALCVASWGRPATAVALASETPPATGLPQLIASALRNNKDLQAATYAIQIARARLVQAGLRPNPRLELSAQSDFLFGNEGQYASSVGVSQEFPVAGRLARQKDLARVDIALAEAEVANAQRLLADDVAGRYYRLAVGLQRVAGLEGLIAAEEGLAKTTRARFHAAEVSEMDVNTVQLDIQRLLLERSLSQSEQQALLASLNALLGRSPDTPLLVAPGLATSESLPALGQVQRNALRQRPDLAGAMLAVDRAAAERALAQSTRWQDWTVGVSLAQDRQVISGLPPQGTDRAIGLTLSIPLPLINKNQGLIAEAQANRDQASARLEALVLNVSSEVAGAHAEAARLQLALGQFKKNLLPIGERNVFLARQGYSMGLIPVTEVMQAQRQLAEADKSYLTALDQYLQALVRLHAAAGDYLAAPANSTPSLKD